MKRSAEAVEPLGRAQWREGWRRCIFASVAAITLLNGPELDAQPSQQISLEKAQRVLWIARHAAKNQMQDLSLRSVREALENGSPIPSRTDSNGKDIDPEAAERSTTNAIESELHLLFDLWQRQQYDPAAVWDTLLAIILPDNRPEQIFAYQRMESADSLTLGLTDRSVGSLLIRQTLQLARTAKLRELLESRIARSPGELDAWILLMQLAIEENNVTDARLRLTHVTLKLLETAEPDQELPVAITLLRAWTVPQLRDSLIPVMGIWITKTIDDLPDSRADKCATVMSLVLARQLLWDGKSDSALRFLDHADVFTSRMSGSSMSPLIEHHLNAAELLLQFGLEDEAMARLMEVQSLEGQQGTRNPQFISRAAVLTQRCQQWSASGRYEFLRQCLLVQNPTALLSPVVEFGNAERPPDSFLESLPEQLRNAAVLDSAAGVKGRVVSSVTELIIAARESSQSEVLLGELLKLQKENHRAGTHLLTLFYLQNEKIAEATGTLREIRDSLRIHRPENGRDRALSLDLLVAMSAAERPATREIAIEMLDSLVQFGVSPSPRWISAHASEVRALAVASVTGNDPWRLLETARPALWSPSANFAGATGDQEYRRPIWLAHDGVITHQSGTENDSLYFPWPLGGTFEFSVSSLGDARMDGDVGFDGLTCEVLSSAGTANVSGLGIDNPYRRTLQLSQMGTYAGKSVKVTPTQLTFLVNGHPVYSEERTADGSPWLSLFTRGSRVGMWRFPEFSGSPEILPEVSLSNDRRMRGWSCAYFGQTRSSTDINGKSAEDRKSGTPAPEKSPDWSWNDGVITGRLVRDARDLDGMMDQNLQGLLRYDRPLQSGETLTWEFEYSPDRINVHPALGRLAFLIQPDGIRLHWMAVGADEWNWLPADNEVARQSGQRRPAEFPLQPGWNHASLSLQENTISISINGVAAYENTLRQEDSRQFGLFHFRDRTEARARNIVLTGDWPKALTADHMSRLTQSQAALLNNSEHHALDTILGQRAFSTDVADIVQFASHLDPEQRFEFLQDWVIPGDHHPNWRIFGDLAPGDAAPSDGDLFGSNPLSLSVVEKNLTRQSSGGFVISPAMQLVRTAKETGKLPTLQSRVEAIPDSDASDQRAKLAMLILLAIEDDRTSNAVSLLQQMTRMTKSMIHFSDSQVWPELIVAQQSLENPELRHDAIEMLRHVASIQRAGGQPADPAIEKCLQSMISLGELIEIRKNDNHAIGQAPNWQAFRMTRADYRNDGLPQPLWVQHEDGSIQHVSGFEDDMLCYPTPLSGDFEFECELTPVDGEHLLVGYGGFFIKPAAEANDFTRIQFGRDPTVLPKARLVTDQNPVWRYRLVVSQRQVTVFVNDEQLTTDAVPASAPPWLCIRAAAKPGAGIRKVRLTGTPAVPDSIELDTGRDLDGWCRPYFGGGEHFAPRNGIASDWRPDESAIVGAYRSALAGTKTESLLQYFRPMMEDGTLTYSFLYEPGVALAHPALDRLAFLLDRERGVLVHEITNGIWERSGLDPANATAEPEHQLVNSLPLIEKDWNVLKVQLIGDTITLILNDIEVFRKPIETSNHRTFGLFHFRDETSARVRKISWQGNWDRPNN